MDVSKLISCFVVSLSFNILGFGTTEISDSLYSKLKSIEEPNLKIKEATNLIRANAIQNFDFADTIAEYFIDWAYYTKDNYNIGFAYQEKAILYSIRREFKKSIPYVKESIKYFEKTENNLKIGYNYRNLGVAYFYSNQIDSSIKAHFSALSYLDPKQNEHKLFYGLTCEELGKVFYESQNPENAKNYTNKAYEIYLELGDSVRIYDIYTLLSLTRENTDSSLFFLDKVISYSLSNGDSFRLHSSYANYGNILIQEGRYEEAKKYSLMAFHWFQNFEHFHLSKVTVNLSSIYLRENKIDSAEYFLRIAIENGKKLNENYTLAIAYSNLTKIAELEGNYKLAYENVLQKHEYVIKNLGLERDRQIKAHELEIELENKNRELSIIGLKNDLLESRSNYQKTVLIGLLIGIFLLILLVIFIWKSQKKLAVKNKQLSENNQIINRQKQNLEELVENNKNLFAIIGHDLRGPIANVYAALDFIPTPTDKLSDETEEIIDLTKSSIQSVSDLLENLLIWSKTEKNDYKLIVKKFVVNDELEGIISLYKLNEKTKGLKFNLPSTEHTEFTSDPFIFRTIIRNLLSNAIKFTESGSTISITTHLINEKLEIVFEDEAGGLPDEYLNFINSDNSTEPMQGISKGLGLKLIKQLSGVINTTINCVRTEKGSKFTLVFNQIS